MLNWEHLIGEAVLAAVLPAAYAHYVRPIRGALIVFLESLPAADQRDILARQAALAPDAGPAERLTLLARTCPMLHKLGQTLARDHRLSVAFRQRLQQLESLPPSLSFPVVERLLTHELGPLKRLGLGLIPPILAEGSVAVVAAFRGTGRRQDRTFPTGVFKMLKPGIEERLERELAALPRIGSYLDEQCDALGIPHLDYQESLEQVRTKLRLEIRLDLEQQHLRTAAAMYRADPAVRIPALLAPCTRRVTAMEQITGRKITDHPFHSPRDKQGAAEVVISALLAKPLFSRDSHALFHADPHAGNLFLTADERLAILDWSLVGTLAEEERVAMVQIILGAMTLHPARIIAALGRLADQGRIDHAALEPVVRAALQRIRRGVLPGLNWLVAMLDEVIQTGGLRVRGELLMFRKTLHALEGVLADIGAAPDAADWALGGEFVAHLASEWPQRWLVPPTSRALATRLSTADLADLMLAFPTAAMQFWAERVAPHTYRVS